MSKRTVAKTALRMPILGGVVIARGNSPPVRLSIREMGEWELKRKSLEAVIGVAKGMFSIGRGRRWGSQTKNRASKTTRRAPDRKKKPLSKKGVLSKIRTLYKTFRRDGLAAMEAEFKVNKTLVAERLPGSRGKLDYWLKKWGVEFEDLKNEAVLIAEEEFKRLKIN